MPFNCEKKPLAKAPGEIRLERADARFVDALPCSRARRKPFDLAGIPRRRYNQRAVASDRRVPRPPVDRLRAARDDALGGALALAMRREHAPGEPGAGALP